MSGRFYSPRRSLLAGLIRPISASALIVLGVASGQPALACNETKTIVVGSAIDPGWVIIAEQTSGGTSYYTIKNVTCATYGTTESVLSSSPLPDGWVVTASAWSSLYNQNVYTIRCLTGGKFLSSETILAGVSPIPANWVIYSEQGTSGGPSYQYIRCLYGAPYQDSETVLSYSPRPSGWVITNTSNSGNYTYYTIQNNNRITTTITTPSTTVTVASGTSVAFAASTTDSNTGTPLTYSWNFGDGYSGSGTSSSHAFTNTGTANATYTVTFTAVDPVTGQIATATRLVTVTPMLGASITSPSSNLSTTTGNPIAFSGNAWGGTTPYSYAWTFGDGGTASTPSASHTYTTSGTFTVTFTVTDSSSPVRTAAATRTVSVTPAVAPSITAQPASSTVYAGQSATFSVTASGTSPFSYQWRKNGVSISGATSASYATPATTTADSGSTYSVVVGNAGGSVTSSAASLTVLANNPPVFASNSQTFFSSDYVLASQRVPVSYSFVATDPEKQAVTFSLEFTNGAAAVLPNISISSGGQFNWDGQGNSYFVQSTQCPYPYFLNLVVVAKDAWGGTTRLPITLSWRSGPLPSCAPPPGGGSNA